MKIYLKKVPNLVVPSQAHPKEDAAYDIVAASEPNIVGEYIERPLDSLKVWKRIAYIEYRTNLFMYPEPDIMNFPTTIYNNIEDMELRTVVENFHVQIFPRSSLSGKNLVLGNSVATIDAGYRAEVLLRYKYIIQPEDLVIIPETGTYVAYTKVNEDHIYHFGDRIAQMQAVKNTSIDFEVVDALPDSSRKEGAFGSSGK